MSGLLFKNQSCLGHAFPRSPLCWSCYPVRTLMTRCPVVSTLLCCLKHRRHHIVMQSLCLANGAIATGTIIVATRYFQESSNRNLYGIIYQAYCACITVSYTILKCYRANFGTSVAKPSIAEAVISGSVAGCYDPNSICVHIRYLDNTLIW
jgi:hypothetical protein